MGEHPRKCHCPECVPPSGPAQADSREVIENCLRDDLHPGRTGPLARHIMVMLKKNGFALAAAVRTQEGPDLRAAFEELALRANAVVLLGEGGGRIEALSAAVVEANKLRAFLASGDDQNISRGGTPQFGEREEDH